MIEELAVVVATDQHGAEVEPQRRAGCDGCGVRGACGTSLIDRFLGRRPVRLHVANAIDAKVGDRVIIGLEESILTRAALAAYLVPLLGLILFAILARELARAFHWPGAELWSMAGALVGFVLALRWVAGYGRRLRAHPRYRALLLRHAVLVSLHHDPRRS